MTTFNTTQSNLDSLPTFESIRSSKNHRGFMNRHRHCACGRPAELTREQGRWHRQDACSRCQRRHGRGGPDTPPSAPVLVIPLALAEAA